MIDNRLDLRQLVIFTKIVANVMIPEVFEGIHQVPISEYTGGTKFSAEPRRMSKYEECEKPQAYGEVIICGSESNVSLPVE
jgi:hypothetical protein